MDRVVCAGLRTTCTGLYVACAGLCAMSVTVDVDIDILMSTINFYGRHER